MYICDGLVVKLKNIPLHISITLLHSDCPIAELPLRAELICSLLMHKHLTSPQSACVRCGTSNAAV